MDALRVARYVAKIDHARRRLAQVALWIDEAAKSEQAGLATYKAFQEAAEAAADLAAMACVDSGRPAQDDYANFRRASELGIVPPAFVRALEEATGLRNRLIHEYDGLDSLRAVASMRRLGPGIESFLEEVERWLSKMT